MLLRDLSDAFDWIRKLKSLVDRIYNGAFLEDSSVTDGRMRFIGGQLLIDSGGRLTVVGTLEVDGLTTVTGEFTVSGPWTMTGDGTISGDVTVTGDIALNGKLVTGGIRIEAGKIYVGAGGSQIIIDGATGKLTAGNMVIDPASGGSVTFPGGATVKGGSSGGVEVTAGSYKAVVTSGGASVGKSGLNLSITDALGFQAVGLPTVSRATIGNPPVGVVYADGTNRLFRAI